MIMHLNFFTVPLIAIVLLISSCNPAHDPEHHDEHEEPKVQYTAYNQNHELFAEADPFITGRTSNITTYLSGLSDFKPLSPVSVTLKITVNGQTLEQIADNPVQKGKFSFEIKPEVSGNGTMEFIVKTDTGDETIIIPEIKVYSGAPEAAEDLEKNALSATNTTVFTKEQSWKIDFSTGYPLRESFGQAIKTTARVQPALNDEMMVTAKTNGIVSFSGNSILEGTNVSEGQPLLMIKGSGFAENNSAVRYAEAQNNFVQAKADFERVKLLAAGNIASDRQLLDAKTHFENARTVYENLSHNFSLAGQTVNSPMAGYVRQILVENGQYAEAGQPLVLISRNNSLLLRAEVQQKYAGYLNSISTATIRRVEDNKTFTLEELKGKIMSVGKAATSDNYLIPLTIQVSNSGGLIPGSFVELYLKTLSDTRVLTIPDQAILEEQGRYSVFVQVTPELFEKREIKTGQTDGMRTEVISGLADDERIITKGAVMVRLAQAAGALDAHSGHVH